MTAEAVSYPGSTAKSLSRATIVALLVVVFAALAVASFFVGRQTSGTTTRIVHTTVQPAQAPAPIIRCHIGGTCP